MALELHIAGPGLDVSRRLQPGDPALILGRDADCTVCLPDPERNVSRRHLSVWNEGDDLHCHVLSVVNGVEVASGELPPGARGVLPVGETLTLSAYRLTVAALDGDPTEDPWTVLETQSIHPMDSQQTLPASALEDDPFGDWGFESTFGPGAPAGSLDADALAAATDLSPFFQGLGLDPARHGTLTQGELETMGRLTRIALSAMLQAVEASAESRRELRAEDRTVVSARETNPLRLDSSLDAKLLYLFGGRAAGVGFIPPDRAVGEMASELLAHERALIVAVQQAVEGAVLEFEPELLKARLLGTGARLFESARAWDAYAKEYGEQRRHLEQWVQQLLDRHFGETYMREFEKARREPGPRRR